MVYSINTSTRNYPACTLPWPPFSPTHAHQTAPTHNQMPTKPTVTATAAAAATQPLLLHSTRSHTGQPERNWVKPACSQTAAQAAAVTRQSQTLLLQSHNLVSMLGSKSVSWSVSQTGPTNRAHPVLMGAAERLIQCMRGGQRLSVIQQPSTASHSLSAMALSPLHEYIPQAPMQCKQANRQLLPNVAAGLHLAAAGSGAAHRWCIKLNCRQLHHSQTPGLVAVIGQQLCRLLQHGLLLPPAACQAAAATQPMHPPSSRPIHVRSPGRTLPGAHRPRLLSK